MSDSDLFCGRFCMVPFASARFGLVIAAKVPCMCLLQKCTAAFGPFMVLLHKAPLHFRSESRSLVKRDYILVLYIFERPRILAGVVLERS